MNKTIKILSLLFIISPLSLNAKEKRDTNISKLESNNGVFKKYVASSDVSYINEWTFNRLALSGNFDNSKNPKNVTINGEYWSYYIYYAKKGGGICDSYPTSYSFYHEELKDDVKVSISTGYSLFSSEGTGGGGSGGVIVSMEISQGVSKSFEKETEILYTTQISKEEPSGKYTLYYTDIRCDAIIKAYNSFSKKTVYMYGKKVEQGISIKLSQTKPVNTYFPCC